MNRDTFITEREKQIQRNCHIENLMLCICIVPTAQLFRPCIFINFGVSILAILNIRLETFSWHHDINLKSFAINMIVCTLKRCYVKLAKQSQKCRGPVSKMNFSSYWLCALVILFSDNQDKHESNP